MHLFAKLQNCVMKNENDLRESVSYPESFLSYWYILVICTSVELKSPDHGWGPCLVSKIFRI